MNFTNLIDKYNATIHENYSFLISDCSLIFVWNIS